MNDQNDQKNSIIEHFRSLNSLSDHRIWYIYTAAAELHQPFSLQELQDAIYRKINVRPHIPRMLTETHNFYQQHNIAVISRLEPESDMFVVNESIDLQKPLYRDILCPPHESKGRPRKNEQIDHQYHFQF